MNGNGDLPERRRSAPPTLDRVEAVARAISMAKDEVREEFNQRLVAAAATADARRDGLVDAIEGARTATANAHADTARRIESLQSVFEERLNGVTRLTDERFEAQRLAVIAAFAAQEKLGLAQNQSNAAAIAKSEAATAKELESLDGKIISLRDAVASDIRNLEGRLNRGEASRVGARQAEADSRDSLGTVLGVIGAVTGGLALLMLIFNTLSAHLAPPAPPTVLEAPPPAATSR
jgi:hypothetical protein